MKILNKYKKLIAGFILFALTAFTVGAVSAFIQPGSIQYQGKDTPAAAEPAFNVYYDVPYLPANNGNEADFIRVKKTNESNDKYRNSINTVCETGDRFDIWIYAHNGASVSGNNNGSGPSVIKDAKVRVDLGNDQDTDRFDIKGFLTSSNAGSINDGAVIDCGDDQYKMKFISGNAFLDMSDTLVDLPASIVGNGTPFGTNALDGSFWGCWDQRVWMGIIVEVEKIEKPVLEPATCDNLLYALLANKQVRVDEVKYTANDATVNSVTVDYGDGTKSNQIPNTHTYDNAGEYNIVATVNTTFEGKDQAITSNKCKATITVDEEAQPQYACEDFKLTWNNRKATASFRPVASNGATFKDALVKYYADGSVKNEVTTNQINNDGNVVTSFTYDANAKNIEVTAKVRFTVGEGKDAIVKEVDCGAKDVLGTTVEKCPIPGKENLAKNDPSCKLPDTGAGSVAGLMAAVTAAGMFIYRKLALRSNQ